MLSKRKPLILTKLQSSYNYDIESLLILPVSKTHMTFSYTKWCEVMKPYLENMIEYIFSHLYSLSSNGFSLFVNRSELGENLQKYIYKVSSNRSKRFNI